MCSENFDLGVRKGIIAAILYVNYLALGREIREVTDEKRVSFDEDRY